MGVGVEKGVGIGDHALTGTGVALGGATCPFRGRDLISFCRFQRMTPGSCWLVGVVDKDAEPRERGSALVGTVTGVARGVMYRIAVGALFKRTCAGLCTLCPDDFGVSRD